MTGTTLRMPAWARGPERLLLATGEVHIHHITLDGRIEHRGPFDDYEQQQSSLIELLPGANATIHDVMLRGSPGDGITLRDNSHAVISDVQAIDCFRGGITLTGDDCSAVVTRYHGGGDLAPAFIQMESANKANPGPMSLDLSDFTTPKIELEAPPGSVVWVRDGLILAGLSLWAFGGGSVLVEDCDIGMVDGRALNEIRHPADVTFRRCHFRGAHILLTPWTEANPGPAYQRLTFEDCTFTGSGPAAIYNNGSPVESDHLVTFTGSCTYAGFDAGYVLHPGRYGPTSGSLTPA